MSEFLFSIVIAIGLFVGIKSIEGSEVETRLDRYTMKFNMTVSHISLEDAGKIERALREWFPEVELVNVQVVADSVSK